jgi:hypothetical protein
VFLAFRPSALQDWLRTPAVVGRGKQLDAGFTEAAQRRNIELGVLIRSPLFASRLADHFEALIAARLLTLLPRTARSIS